MNLISTSLGRFRILSVAEGISFLLLLGVAMPLKYLAGFPEAVEITGMLHGVLFVLYVLAAINLMVAMRWSLGWLAAAFIAAVLPLGPFVLEARLRRNAS